MKARYQQLDVQRVDGRVLHAGFRFENLSGHSEGVTISYQIFDSETEALLVDGKRLPAGPERLDLHIQLPAEPGRYRVFISPMQEGVAWFYEKGWEFLLIEAVVVNGHARVERYGVTTAATIRRERFLRSIGRAFTYPLRTIRRNRGLIRTLVRRDILGRYRGSFGGVFWTVLNPLLLMLTYFFVFGIVLRARFGADPSRSGFALYFLAGILPWLAFSEAAGRAPTVILEHRNFVKRLIFPVETLPLTLVASGLVNELFGVALFVTGCGLIRGYLPLSAFWLPVLLVPQILFTAGVCWFLAALGVFVRDLGQIIGFLLTLWFFLTPICYPEASLPQAALPILGRNPIHVLVRGYRAIFLEGHAPAFGPLWKLWVVALVVFILGHAWFHKLRRSFADML